MIDKNFYNTVFSKSIRYNVPYKDSPDYRLGVWPDVVSRLKDERVLELGCGTGQFAEMIKDSGVCESYLGIDYSDVAIEKADKLGDGYKFICCDIEDRNYVGDYTVVIILETLEHIDGDSKLIESLPEGMRVIFSVPSFPAPQHFRCFDTINDVISRYDKLINIKYSRIFGGKHRIYLCDGNRSCSI